jgi:hypothetical protein
MPEFDLVDTNSWVIMWEWSENMEELVDDDMSMDEEVVYNWEVPEETEAIIENDEMLDE